MFSWLFVLIIAFQQGFWPDYPTPAPQGTVAPAVATWQAEVQTVVECSALCVDDQNRLTGIYVEAVAAVKNGGLVNGVIQASCLGIKIVLLFWMMFNFLTRAANGWIVENKSTIRETAAFFSDQFTPEGREKIKNGDKNKNEEAKNY
jgi:hypothetical protein